MTLNFKSQRAFSLSEMLVVIAVSVILILAITMFVSRSFQLKRIHFEQAQITEDARIQMRRISEQIKNGRYMDCNNNKVIENYGPPPERWLLAANKYALTFRTNLDDDDEAEQVSYFLNANSELTREVSQISSQNCAINEAEKETTIVLKDVRNRSEERALFEYYANGGAKPVAIADGVNNLTFHQLSAVELVGINLMIDANPNQNPSAALVSTAAQPRMASNNLCEGESSIVPINVPRTGNYVRAAFQQCQDYCGGTVNELVPDACCGWHSFIIGNSPNGSELLTMCSCNAGDVVGGETVTDDNFTYFTNVCLGEGGKPDCDAGCLTDVGGEGQCVCTPAE